MSFKKGDRVMVTCCGESCAAIVVLASEHETSLAVEFERGGGLKTSHGAWLVGMALLLVDGEYRELFSGDVIGVSHAH